VKGLIELFLMSDLILYIAVCISGVHTLLLCLYARPISLALGIMDIPDERKRHRIETPLMGGIALLIGFIPTATLWILIESPPEWKPLLLFWLTCIALMSLIGLADDRHTLSARNRLLFTFFIFGAAAIYNPLFQVRVLSFEYFGFEFGLGLGLIAIIFTMVCCVGLVNAVNMAEGKNGLVIGLCLGCTALLALRAPTPILPMLGLLAAVLAVLLVFNLRGRLFLGDGGAYGIACAIGLLAVMIYNSPGAHANRAISADELMLLYAVPVIDSFRLTVTRMRRGQSPMAADRDHLHHHLQDRFGWPGGLIVYWVVAILPSFMVFLSHF
jgi:UDP-GlcNAc:undecaprenyl-phosphate/decaprenyl-phosphate GlcNAc-1-phosphate transferase